MLGDRTVVQAPAAVDGIRMTVSLYCSIPFLLAVGLLFFYEIDKRMETRIERELGERRRQGGSNGTTAAAPQ